MPTVVAIGLARYSYALIGKINRKPVGFDEKSAHLHAFTLVACATGPMSGEDERNIHAELMQVSLIVVV